MASSFSDDGFDDFLSEDEEECALQTQEMAALERRMKTEGIRDGIEFGKEGTLQQGFDQGFALGAAASHRFSVLRGALSAAKAVGLSRQLDPADQRACDAAIASLRKLEVQSALPSESPAIEIAASDAELVVEQARSVLEKLRIGVPMSDALVAGAKQLQ